MRRSIYRLSSGGRGGEGLGCNAARRMMKQAGKQASRWREGFSSRLRSSHRQGKARQGKRLASRVELSYLSDGSTLELRADKLLRVRRATMTARRCCACNFACARCQVTDGVMGECAWERWAAEEEEEKGHVLTAAVCAGAGRLAGRAAQVQIERCSEGDGTTMIPYLIAAAAAAAAWSSSQTGG